MRIALAAILLCLASERAMSPAGAEEISSAPPKCPAGTAASGQVVEAIDGDTLKLSDGTLVRLAAIEAPKAALGPDFAAYAEPARLALAGLAVGRPVTLAPVGEGADRHNRLHAFIAGPDGKSLQSEMLGLGFARVHLLPGEDGCAADLLAQEDSARAAGRGLWASHASAIRKADDPSLLGEIGLYELVEGRVLSVGRRSRLVFLDFGRNWQDDFTVMVEKAAADRLAEAGRPVEMLAKRLIRVRGVIEQSGGPAIRIAEPSAIEILDDGEK